MTPEYFAPMASARTRQEIHAALGSMSTSMGFPLYTAMYVGLGRCGAPESVILSNVPPAFAEASQDLEASRRDPVLRTLRFGTAPFIYAQATYVDAGAGDLWEEQAVHGYRSGIAMSLRLSGGRRFLLGFDTPDRISSDGTVRTMLMAQIAATAVVASETFERVMFDEVGDAFTYTGAARLSPREAQVLPYLAKGLSGPEISQVLRVSRRTVEKHIQGAMRKLGASRQAEVIGAAMRMDLLDDCFNLSQRLHDGGRLRSSGTGLHLGPTLVATCRQPSRVL